jgi:hypothetical protein
VAPVMKTTKRLGSSSWYMVGGPGGRREGCKVDRAGRGGQPPGGEDFFLGWCNRLPPHKEEGGRLVVRRTITQRCLNLTKS